MLAPPAKEDTAPFLRIRQWLAANAIHVPQLIAQHIEQGFLLLEDFGDTTWAVHVKQQTNITPLMHDAMRQLHALQQATVQQPALPHFDIARMQQECRLYTDWYLPHVAKINLPEPERMGFIAAITPHLHSIAALPQAPVHLDFHSRNLMLPTQHANGLPLGIIDFQDAVTGPVTYDLASLLYDCYQNYPETERKHWSHQFYQQLPPAWQSAFEHREHWHTMLRLTALQRHIKAIGIFARLAYRDGKTTFLNEIPLTRQHLREEMSLFELSDHVRTLLLHEPASLD